MRIIFGKRIPGAVAVGAVAIAIVGCGDNNEGDTDPTTTAEYITPRVTPTPSAISIPSETATGSPGDGALDDTEYVVALCKNFQAGMVAGFSAMPQGAIQEQQVEATKKALDVFEPAIEDIEPPADAAEYHSTLLETIDGIRTNNGVLEELQFMETPADVQDKYLPLAQDEPACAAAPFFKDPPGS